MLRIERKEQGSCMSMSAIDAAGGKGEAAYPVLDAIKLAAAIVVVGIHTRPFLGTPLHDFSCRIDTVAVPFFLISTGFLAVRAIDPARPVHDAASAYARRARTLLAKYARLSMLYLPLNLFGAWTAGVPAAAVGRNLIYGFLIRGENYFSWPLWYLLAAGLGCAVIALLLRRGITLRSLGVLSAVLFASGYYFPIWAAEGIAGPSVVMRLFGSTRNFLMIGIPYLFVGLMMARYRHVVRALPIAVPVSGLLFWLVGAVGISGDANMPFCAIGAASIFALGIRIAAPRGIAAARRLSESMYDFHMIAAVIAAYGVLGYRGSDFILAQEVDHVRLFLLTVGGTLAEAGALGLIRKARSLGHRPDPRGPRVDARRRYRGYQGRAAEPIAAARSRFRRLNRTSE